MSTDPVPSILALNTGWIQIEERLRSSGKTSSEFSMPLDVRVRGRACHLVADENSRGLFVPIESLERLPGSVRETNLKIQPIFRDLGHFGQLWVEIRTDRQDLYNRFSELTHGVLAALQSDVDTHTAIESTLAEFRELLQRSYQEISPSVLAGLFGELMVLDILLGEGYPLSSWVGPEGSPQDFVLPHGSAVEVKTLGDRDDQHVHISNLEQLAASRFRRLLLVVVKLGEDRDALSLSEMCRRILPLVDEDAFHRQLQRTGLGSWDSEIAREACFRLVGIEWFEVGSGFPSITPDHFPGGELPRGLERATYYLDPRSLRSWAVSSDRALEMLRETDDSEDVQDAENR